jgi:hypothetical protein
MSEEQKAGAAIAELADARILDGVERRAHGIQVREPDLKPLQPVRTHLDPADWGAGYLVEPREYDVPLALLDDLKERTPQALLRDLHRPVHEPAWHEREVLVALDRAGRDALRDARAAQRIPPVPSVAPTARAFREELQRRRAFLREKWQPRFPDDQPRKPPV